MGAQADSPPIDLIVGIGNPGADYAATRHNAGIWCLERLAEQLGAAYRQERKFFGRLAEGRLAGRALRLLIPGTMMNESGKSVGALAAYYKVPAARCLIVHDEIDLPAGRLRFKLGGGTAGHRGLGDIVKRFGGDQGFARLRLGVGHPGGKEQVLGHVLGRISRKEKRLVDDAIAHALAALPLAVQGQWQQAMNQAHAASL